VLGARCSTRERVYPDADAAAARKLFELLADDGRARIVRCELEEPLVRGDRRRGVTDLLGRLRELELDVRVVRLERDERLYASTASVASVCASWSAAFTTWLASALTARRDRGR
jgi:hypothetical protein